MRRGRARRQALPREEHPGPRPPLPVQALQQGVQRQLGVAQRADDGRVHGVHQLAKGGRRRQAQPQRHHADEGPQGAGEAGLGPAGDGGPEHEIGLRRVALEQHPERGQQQAEERDFALGRDGLQPPGQVLGQGEAKNAAAVARRLDGGEVHGQGQVPGRALEGGAGVGPGGAGVEAGLGAGEVGEGRDGPRVLPAELPQQEGHRAQVRDGVVQGQPELVVLGAAPQQVQPDERPLREVEGRERRGLQGGRHLLVPPAGRVDVHEPGVPFGPHAGHGHAVEAGEARPQGAVARDGGGEAVAQERRLQRPAQGRRHGQVVGRAAGRELLEQPDPALRAAEGVPSLAGVRDQREQGLAVLLQGRAQRLVHRAGRRAEAQLGALDPELHAPLGRGDERVGGLHGQSR